MNFFGTSGKGLGSFVGGQLSQLPMGLTGVFASTSIFMGSAGMGILMIYLIWGRAWERQVVEEKKVVLDEMEDRQRRDNSENKREDTFSTGEELSTKL